jgi:hypothetical protein
LVLEVRHIPPDFSPEVQLLRVKEYILGDVRAALAEGQRNGFPTDAKDYTLFLQNGGRTSRRALATISPRFLRIGTRSRPLMFTFVGKGGMEVVIEAAQWAFSELQRRAPVRTGAYRAAMALSVNGGRSKASSLTTDKLKDGDSVELYNQIDYASTIEARRLRPGGPFLSVVRDLNARYGSTISCRMIYNQGAKYQYPVIQIKAAGEFLFSVTLPGQNERRRARARRGRR